MNIKLCKLRASQVNSRVFFRRLNFPTRVLLQTSYSFVVRIYSLIVSYEVRVTRHIYNIFSSVQTRSASFDPKTDRDE